MPQNITCFGVDVYPHCVMCQLKMEFSQTNPIMQEDLIYLHEIPALVEYVMVSGEVIKSLCKYLFWHQNRFKIYLRPKKKKKLRCAPTPFITVNWWDKQSPSPVLARNSDVSAQWRYLGASGLGRRRAQLCSAKRRGTDYKNNSCGRMRLTKDTPTIPRRTV